jgi:hypothetical protein
MFLEIQHDEIRKTMKNLLFILALLPGLAFATRDTIIASGKWNVSATWADGTAPGAMDTVYKINNGTFNDTLDADYTIVAFICDTLTAGAHIRTGYTLEVTGSGINYSDKGSGVRNYGIKTKFSGDGGVAYYSAAAGAVTASLCTLHVAASCSTHFMDAIDWNKVRIDNSDAAKISGSGAQSFNSTVAPMTIGDNGSFLSVGNAATVFNRTTSGMLIETGLNPSFSIGNFQLRIGASGIKCTLPDFTASAVGNGFYISTQAVYDQQCTVVMHNVLLPIGSSNAILNVSDASNTSVLHTMFIGDSISCYKLQIRGAIAGTSLKHVYFGSNKIMVGAGGITRLATTSTAEHLYWQTSNVFCSGTITYFAGLTVDPGTSLVTLNGTGAQTITSAGKSFYDLTINNSGTAFVALADSLTANDVTLTDGPFNAASYGISAADLIYTSQDSVRFQNLWLTGDYTRGATATKSDTSGQHIRFSAAASHTMAAAGKTYARVTTSGPLTITGGATIATLSYGVDGIPVTIATGTTLTAGTVSIGGSAGALDTMRSGTPGTRCTLDLAGNQTITVSYAAIGDVFLAAGDTILVNDGKSKDLGNNSGNIVFPASGSGGVFNSGKTSMNHMKKKQGIQNRYRGL